MSRNGLVGLLFAVASVAGLVYAQTASLVLNDGGLEFPDGTVQVTAAAGAPSPAPQTGQTKCWDANGTEIVCSDTGQDGDLRKGVKWPDPRFTDNGDGTVADNLTGLVWLRNANCFGQRNWDQAMADPSGLASPSCNLSDGSLSGDWRLPNINELYSLISYESEDYSTPPIPGGHPFVNLEQAQYWASTTLGQDSERAWSQSFTGGGMHSYYKDDTDKYVWPVRGGQ